MKKKIVTFLTLLYLTVLNINAQTNPTATALPFTLNSQSSSTLPAGVAVHRFSSIPTTRTLSAATGGNLPNQGSSPTSTTGGWYHLSADGIGLLSSTSNPAGAVVVAINTVGLSNVSVSWLCKTIRNQSARDNSIALQYRVGTSGNFIDVGTTSTYTSNGKADGHTSSTFTETLPTGAENQAVVQVRWIYWESVSTSGSRDKISIDNISITATGTCNSPTPITASSITTNGATIGWATVSGSSSYQYAVTTSSTPPSSGTVTTSTSVVVTGLAVNTTYYAHARTNCSGSFSIWTSTSFTTNDTVTGDSLQFKLMAYNLLNYPGSTGSSREPSYRIILDSARPDIVVAQEVLQSTGANNFLNNVLNFSSTTFSLATFIDGPDTDNALYYKTAKFQFISNTVIATSLRDINEFRLKHNASGDTLIVYSVHLKAGNSTADADQRAAEADSLRKRTNALASGKYFLVCGDFNVYESSENAYQNLIQNGSAATGKFFDPISISGVWNDATYAIHHTQSPRTTSFGGGATGGLDDRFDMFLFSDAITQAGGFDVVANTYKSFGNDGQHYNQALNTPPYGQYSSTLTQAIHDASDHLPVVVTLTYTQGSPRIAQTNHQTKQGSLPFAHSTTNSIKETNAETLSIYPNPAQSEITVQLNASVKQPVQLIIYDVIGKAKAFITLENTHSGSVQKINLDALNLTEGIYFIQSETLSLNYKLVICSH